MKPSKPSILCGIVGAGGFGREVMPLVDYSLYWKYIEAKPHTRLCFVESHPHCDEMGGIPVLSLDTFMAQTEPKYFTLAIADSKRRESLAEQLVAGGAEPLHIQAPTHQNMWSNQIGDGAIFCHYTMVTSNSRIGKYFHANIYSYIGHDCRIGDYVTFAPSVKCNGHVHIGDYAYIGTGACIKQGTQEAPLVIGEGAVIGMGAVVTRSVPPYTTVIGNPARPMQP